MRRRSSLLRLLFALLFLLSSCGSCSKGDDADQSSQSSGDGASIPEFEEGEIHTETLTPETLLPVIQAIGYPGASPRRIAVQFVRNVVNDNTARLPGNLYTIEPPVPGTIQFSTHSTLEFVPMHGFKPGQEYTFSLHQVVSRDGPMIPATPWTHTFTTPKFAFVDLSGAVLRGDQEVSVDLRFSAPINPDRLAAYASWRYNGARVQNVTYARGSEGNVARATLRSTSFAQGGELQFSLDDGFPFDAEAIAPAAKASVTIEAGQPVELFTVTAREGADGFFLEVVCKDDASPGHLRYYYDRTTYHSYRISRRCMPVEGAEKLISINPPVEFKIGAGEAGFNLIGDFRRGNYTVQIDSGLRTIDGGVVGQPLRKEVTVTSRSPVVTFPSKGRYVPRDEWSQLPVRHLNVDEVTVTIRHIPQRNAAFWLSGNETATSRTSTIIAREVVKFTGKSDEFNTSMIDVQKMVKDVEPGVYEVKVSTKSVSDALRLVPTDLNLVMKVSAPKPEQWSDSAFVWAINMKTLKPESGVKIDVIRPSGDVLSTCDTDASGGCRLSIPVLTVDDSAPFAIVAQRGDEFTYLRYQDVETPVKASSGEDYLASATYRTAIWSDRGVYRPGETAHLAAVLRTDQYDAPKAGVPVTLELMDARRKLLTRRVVKTNEAGVVTLDQPFADFAPTGQYVLNLKVADAAVGSYRFNVEEFVPERMRVSATTMLEHYAVGEQIAVDVEAEYLFGGSAEGATVELTCRVVPSTFEPDNQGDYFFGLASTEPQPMDLETVHGTITAAGKVSVACPALGSSSAYQRAGTLEATAAVLEAGSGRTTTALAKTNVHPASFYVGLKSGATSVTAGKAVTVEGIVVDWQGKPYTKLSELDVELIQLHREYWWYQDDEGESNYGRNIRPVTESTQKVAVGADGTFKITAVPTRGGSDWVVAVSAANARTELRLRGGYSRYYWDGGYGGRYDDTPRPSAPTEISVKGPDTVRVGAVAEFEVEVPFKGRMLITAETHEVVGYEWVDVEAGTFRWKHTLQKFVPNIYVTALLVKSPYLDGSEIFAPDRAFGAKSFRVEPSEKLHTLALTAPTEIQPDSTLEVTLDIGPQSGTTFATVAAVDEGILSLTRFATPDPSRKLFAQRALGVTTYETVGWSLQAQPGGASSDTGGDWDEAGEFGDGKGRLMPVKPVALWSGLVEIGPSGKATVKFDVPRYRGALRVMAVTADAQRTGHADARVFVREPIVTQATLPRFLSGGDEVQVPVFLTNMSGAATEVVVTLEAEEVDTNIAGERPSGPVIELQGAATKTLRLADQASGSVVFRAKALRQAGGAMFRVTAKSSSYTAVEEAVVPFRPNGAHERITQVLELQNGKNSLQSVLDGWVPTSERTNFAVTSNPYGHAFGHLRYLVRYPYGCLEQVTSATRPLLHIAPLVEQFDPEFAGGDIDKMVDAGIRKVFAMQTPDGGFSYWPGSGAATAWATAYAVDMLLDAKEAKFDVPQERLDEALQWLHDQVMSGRSRSFGYIYGEAYMHYVLARVGKGNVAKIQSLLDASLAQASPTQPDLERQYMLKAALYLAGNRRYEKDLRAPDISELELVRDRYSHYMRSYYYSDLRRRGMMLSIFHTLFGTRREGEPLARMIADQLGSHRRSRYFTTQELAWGTIALGKWVAGSKANFGDAKLVLDGKRPRPTNEVAGRSDRSWEIYRASEYNDPHIELSGKDGKVYAVISSQGVRVDSEPRVGGEGLKISRIYYDREGRELEPDQVKLGDLVYTLIDVSNTTGHDQHNLVLVDRLPAGWEIENPRLGRGTLPVGIVDEDQLWEPDYMSLRDDRIEVFGTLPKYGSVKLLYAVRAVSAGDFQAPGPEIEAMYDPTKWAAGPSARVKVRGLAD